MRPPAEAGPREAPRSHARGRAAGSRGRLGLVCLAACGAASLAPGPLLAVGRPPLRNYGPPGHIQYWAIAQAADGLLYFGSGDGIARYDGARWRIFPVASRVTVRSLAVAPDGRIYVGAQGELGYLDPAQGENAPFVSLLRHVRPADRVFQDVWKTHVVGSTVYFQAYDRLFRWSDGAMRSWPPRSAFHFSHVVDGTLYVADREAGLLRLRGDVLEPVPGGGAIAGDRLYLMLRLSPGEILLGTRDRLLLYDGAAMRPWPTEADDWLRQSGLYHGALLPGGRIALGTARGGLAILDSRGGVVTRLDRATGLNSDSVTFVFADREGALWLAQAGGVSRVELDTPVALFTLPSSGNATPLSIAAHEGRMFVGTTVGVERVEVPPGAGPGRSEAVAGLHAQVFQLLSTEGELIAATGEGVYRVAGGRAELLAPGISLDLLASRRFPGRLYVAQIDGVRVLERVDPSWRDLGQLPGVEADVRTLFESPDGGLWLGTKSDGVYRVAIGADPAAARVARYRGPGHGLPEGSVDVWSARGAPLFASDAGLHRFDERSGTFRSEAWWSPAGGGPPARPLAVAEDARGNLWITARRRPMDGAYEPQPGTYEVQLVEPGAAHRRSPLSRATRLLPVQSLTSPPAFDGDGRAWIGAREGLVVIDPAQPLPAPAAVPAPRCVAALVVPAGAGRSAREVAFRPGSRRLAWQENELRLRCSLPSYGAEEWSALRFRLAPLEASWSAWGAEGARSYAAMPAGRHRLLVQARDARDRLSPVLELPLEVAPPWYRTVFALAAAAGLVALLLLAAHRARVRALERRRRELERLVEARTAELQRTEERYRELFENASDVIFALDADGTVTSLNRAAERIGGGRREDMLGRPITDLLAAEDREELVRQLASVPATGTSYVEVTLRTRTGQPVAFEVLVQRSAGGGIEGVARDVTQRRALEEQLEQARKLEAVGRLAAGVAHDFNNLLTVIGGYCEVLGLRDLPQEAREELQQIAAAARRAAELTRQLLAFGRKQRLTPRAVDLNGLVRAAVETLRRTLGERIEIETRLAPDLWPVWADPDQIEQVLLTLGANARDAMPGGGRLTLATANVAAVAQREPALETAAASAAALSPSLFATGAEGEPPATQLAGEDHVVLTVGDTGAGMDEATRARIFEPFFSVTGASTGGGLGLATVFGIVKQTRGDVVAHSRPGEGTTFEIRLPRAPEVPAAGLEGSSGPAAEQAPTVLVADDERSICTLIATTLGREGYRVLSAENGEAALACARELGPSLDLLVTDVVMPDLSGPELARRLRAERPGLRVLFVTGYSGDPLDADPLLARERVLLKPFGPAAIVTAVRGLLGR